MAVLLAAGAAQAQFKVVQPDGSVTYTDRPPPGGGGRVTAMRPGSAASAPSATADSALPPALRALAQRQPVTFYAAADCAPCDAARRLLQQRGIPFAERWIVRDEDIAALERTAGARAVPVLTIGAQPLRGFVADDWNAYLDAAGYPAVSTLPRGWRGSEPRPLTAASAPASPVDAAPAPAASLPAAPPPPPPPSPTRPGVRF